MDLKSTTLSLSHTWYSSVSFAERVEKEKKNKKENSHGKKLCIPKNPRQVTGILNISVRIS